MTLRALAVVLVVAVSTLAVGSGPAGAAEPALATISGEVVDLACYLPHPATGHGQAHRKCAETCAKKGLPMGIVTDDQQVFLLLENHDNPKAYAAAIAKPAEKVTIEGSKVTNGGLQAIVVEAVK
jgi:hypothetical protein